MSTPADDRRTPARAPDQGTGQRHDGHDPASLRAPAVRAAHCRRGPDRAGLRARPASRHLARNSGRAIAPRSISSSREHGVAAVAGYIALYIAVVGLSLPGGALLTVIGGILFGPVVGGARGDRRRARRRDRHLPDREERVRRMADAPRRAARGEARRRLSRRRVQLSAVPAAGAVSVLAGQSRARAVRRPALDLRRRDRDRHPPGDLRLRVLRRRPRQRDRRAGSPIQRLPRRRPRRLQRSISTCRRC